MISLYIYKQSPTDTDGIRYDRKNENKARVELSRFPDGTLANIRFLSMTGSVLHPRKDDHIEVEWLYSSDEEMVILYYLVSYLKGKCKSISLYMPYVPNARMDRKEYDDDIFTLKYFSNFINSLNFTDVCVRDAHSNVSRALINNLSEEPVDYFICDVIEMIGQDDLVLYFPDEGSMKRYEPECYEIPYAFGIKKRDWKSGKIQGIKLVNEEIVRGKDVLIVDDICSRGGTFYYSAKALKDAGARDIYLYVTHCENTILDGDLIESGLVKHIYTTKSIFTKNHEIITVLEEDEDDED